EALAVTEAHSVPVQVVICLVIFIVAYAASWSLVRGGCYLHDRWGHVKVLMYIMFWRIIPRSLKVKFAADAFDKITRANSG
ncbi:hypothetical protein PFISCL1PPCAC_25715, partial [Pristionchus fissidentatus]